MDNILVSIVDDDRLTTDLIGEYLDGIKGLKLQSVHYDGQSFIDTVKVDQCPDILVLDLKMDKVSGKEVIQWITKQELDIKIIVLSSFYHPNYLGFMFQLGVHAFIPKETPKDQLVHVVKTVFTLGHYFDEEQMKVLRKQISTKVPTLKITPQTKLTAREKEVLELLCHQMTAQEIADKLFVSKKTVDTHKANLLLKTGAKNVAGLIIFVAQHKLFDLDRIPFFK